MPITCSKLLSFGRQMVENTALLRMQDGQPLEAVIMAGLAHAQVVHTIAHLMVRAPTSLPAATCRLRSRPLVLCRRHSATVACTFAPDCKAP